MSELATLSCPTCGGTGTLPRTGASPASDTGARIVALMRDREWTQEALARTIGRSQPTISHWINGNRRPSHDDLCILAGLFGVTTDYLLGRS